MGSRAEHFRREFRGERRGCQSPAAAGDWLRRRVGSALSRYRCGGREAAQKWLSYLPLYRPRRLRRPDSSLHRMHVVVRQRPRCYRTSRGGTRDLRACAFVPKPSRITLRGCRSEDRRAVGQFSSNLLNGRFDHLRHAAQQDLGGSILARLIPTARQGLPISDSRFVAAGLAQNDRAIPVETDEMERVLADIDADCCNGFKATGVVWHGMLLILAPRTSYAAGWGRRTAGPSH